MRTSFISMSLCLLMANSPIVHAEPFLSGATFNENINRPLGVKGVWQVDINATSLTADTQLIDLGIPGVGNVQAQRLKGIGSTDDTLTWRGVIQPRSETSTAAEQGSLAAALNRVTLVRHGNKVTGAIVQGGTIYQLRPHNDTHVLQQLGNDENAVIRVLVVGSLNATQAYGGDLRSLARLAIDESNQTYENSDIGLSLELAEYIPLDYRHHPKTAGIMLNCLVNKNCEDLQSVRDAREQFSADIVVALVETDNGEYCGTAAATPATAETAFAVVNWRCIGGRLDFAHEVGHLQGANHEVDQPFTTFAHGYSYLPPGGAQGWGTVMATACDENPCHILPYWSSPNNYLDGVPMGIPDRADNRRMLELTKWHVSQFRGETQQAQNEQLQ